MSCAGRILLDFHGEAVELRCADARILEAIRRPECPWSAFVTASAESEVEAVVEVVMHASSCPIVATQSYSNDTFFLEARRGRLLTGSFRSTPWQFHAQSWLPDVTHTLDNVVTPTLQDVRLRLGLVSVHSAAVALDGRGALLLGPGGSGKSTTALLLTLAGFDFLSDDGVTLRLEEGALVARSSSREILLLPDGAERWAALRFVGELPVRPRPHKVAKHVLRMDRAMPERCLDRTVVSVVTFPEIGDGDETELDPLDAATCLERLLAEAPMLVKDRVALRRQFEVFAALADTASLWRVRLGRKPEGVVAAFRELLSGSGR